MGNPELDPVPAEVLESSAVDATQTSWVVTEQLGSASPVVLRECKGSGPSWNCAGMLWATIPMSDGSLVQLLGAAMPDFQPTSGTWTERK